MQPDNEIKGINHGVNNASGYPTGNPPPYTGLPPGPPGFYAPPGPYGAAGSHGSPLVQTAVYPMPCPAVVITHQMMGPRSTHMTCRSCQKEIETRIVYRPTIRTHIFAAILCALGCIPCAFIPYCVDSCQSADHYCPNCNRYIGSYSG